ncbi:unnamed protein product [Adineta steineri]|uniref:Ig-like domain-containing protein n=1 Tax=Adineta steineri TaxID=433720 RepID=A0A815URF0_9BILA|nr:unnamed protein product [Adineta steineri]CAF1526461.1 unnamed protein product [Adineta steineri]
MITTDCDSNPIVQSWSGERYDTLTMLLNTSITIGFPSSVWMSTLYIGSGTPWSIVSRMNLAQRPDGYINSSPVTCTLPVVSYQRAVSVVHIIPLADNDDIDILRCRWSNANSTTNYNRFDECGGVCSGLPSGTTLDGSSCTLSFILPTANLYYACALQIEDYYTPSSTSPMSSVPVQFLFYAYNASVNACAQRPSVTGARPNRACIGAPVGVQLNETVIVQTYCPGQTIVDIVTSSPIGMTHSNISNPSSGIWTMTLTWTPTATQSIVQGFCAAAIDNSSLPSDPWCITFLVSLDAVNLIQSSATPVGIILQNQTVFRIQANIIITPPYGSVQHRNGTFIYFNDATVNAVVQSFDCAWAPEVTYTDSSVIIQFPIAPWVPGHSYYVTFDSGVVSGSFYCHAESAPVSSPTYWTFNVLPSTTTTTTTTTTTSTTTTTTTRQTTQLPNYSCTENNVSIQFTLSSSSHSAWNPASNCSLQQCNTSLNDNNNCLLSSTPCYDYRTINNISYCAPGILCSILETCNNVTQACLSNTSVCVINSCCSPQAVCLPLLARQMCNTGWFPTANMTDSRYGHTESVLSNGKVLVTGGVNSNFLSSVELYDPSTSTWTITGNMTNARYFHTASVLSNGKVLVTGGWNGSALYSAELYDSSTGIWTSTYDMISPRAWHTASVLSNEKVLVTGGTDSNNASNSAELYDPSTGTWTTAGNMTNARQVHTASVLLNGKLLVTGGKGIGNIVLNSAELYDPSTGTWTTTGNMNDARSDHTVSVLSNGLVLVTGGQGIGSNYLNSAELYNPSTSVWTTTSSMTNARQDHTASVLSNGKVLVTDGYDGFSVLNSVELYDTSTATWTTTSNMNNARAYHTTSVLSNGKVLVTGGYDNGGALNSAELY